MNGKGHECKKWLDNIILNVFKNSNVSINKEDNQQNKNLGDSVIRILDTIPESGRKIF